jgi:hypothetical protein
MAGLQLVGVPHGAENFDLIGINLLDQIAGRRRNGHILCGYGVGVFSASASNVSLLEREHVFDMPQQVRCRDPSLLDMQKEEVPFATSFVCGNLVDNEVFRRLLEKSADSWATGQERKRVSVLNRLVIRDTI